MMRLSGRISAPIEKILDNRHLIQYEIILLIICTLILVNLLISIRILCEMAQVMLAGIKDNHAISHSEFN